MTPVRFLLPLVAVAVLSNASLARAAALDFVDAKLEGEGCVDGGATDAASV